jgi:hypothetical protein
VTSTGKRLLSKYGNLGSALSYAFPEIDWELDKFSQKGKKSIQGWYEWRGTRRTGEGRMEGES